MPVVGGDAVLGGDPDALGGVDAQRVVAVGVPRRPDQRHALAELHVAVDEDDVVGDQVLDPVLDVPGPLHRVQRAEGVPFLALGDQLGVGEERRPRRGLALDRLGGAEDEAEVLDVQVVEADVVDVLGASPTRASASSGWSRSSPAPCRRGTRPGARSAARRTAPRPGPRAPSARRRACAAALEALELDHLEAVDDVDVGVRALGRPAEGELQRVAGRGDVDGADPGDPVLRRREPRPELGRRLADRRRPVATRPGLVRGLELRERLQPDAVEADLGCFGHGHGLTLPRRIHWNLRGRW